MEMADYSTKKVLVLNLSTEVKKKKKQRLLSGTLTWSHKAFLMSITSPACTKLLDVSWKERQQEHLHENEN